MSEVPMIIERKNILKDIGGKIYLCDERITIHKEM